MTHRAVAILISGTGSNMLRLVESMQGADHPARPVLVLSNRPEAKGLKHAAALGVPTAVVDHRGRPKPEFEAEMDAALRDAGAEILCLAGFMRVLSADFIARWEGRILNIHPSLLPLFKGLDTHARAIASGMAVHGATVHEVIADLDAGPILGQAVVPILPDDTPDTLAARLLPAEHRLYPEALRRFAAGNRARFALL
ncbi:phosphoribosylglycinamide formyltransferase [Halovulum dunhuangense]|uniref:Phosphoribosylglycinamide formyltransferase n=1 Tax=Halovulum dunhuangense TaxID=1505036 RepID=A0A849L3Q1_9RHOB|nr:phosphoribosylglycinamide formyltransferase [Halovulum dunhuangense]NNU80797.1 phosphoribosylglycinamide formyltransferase [Halovulum dunhuangense]